MSIEQYIENQKKPNIENFRTRYNNSLNSSQLVEEYIRHWLHLTPNIQLYSTNQIQSLVKRPYYTKNSFTGGTEIKKAGTPRIELDLVFEYKNSLYVGEVKSGKLNGYINKIERNISLLDSVFNQYLNGLIIFLPVFNRDKKRNLENKISQFDRTNIVDTKVKAKDFEL